MELHQPRPDNTDLIRVRVKLIASRRKDLKKTWVGPCIYKVREVKSPYMGVVRGNRILIALPNMEGRKPFDGTPMPCFIRPYLIFQTSDYTDQETPLVVPKIITELQRRGFTRVETSEEFCERMLVQMGYVKPE